ncbi:MAG: biopolymer transporter ExbD [Deltaproteobacteria bacterium]|nr:biopolymer transporter ExbD [Deltaproteobacteria bacterium]
MQAQQKDQIIAGINVTPLVDVVLVLLVIFIVTAKIISVPALSMELPAAASGTETQVVFSVIVDSDGKTFIDGDAIDTDAAFLERAKAAKAANDELRAVIHADGGVAHRRVIRVMDLLRRAGVQRVAFATAALDEAAR